MLSTNIQRTDRNLGKRVIRRRSSNYRVRAANIQCMLESEVKFLAVASVEEVDRICVGHTGHRADASGRGRERECPNRRGVL